MDIRRDIGVAVSAATMVMGACACSSAGGSPAPPSSAPVTATPATGTPATATPATATPATGAPSPSAGAAPGASGVATWPGNPVSETAIPLGDGKVSSSPRIGYEDSCTSNFRGGGARSSPPWIDVSKGTWDAKTKLAVEGSNSWPDATHSFELQGADRVLTTNDLPQASLPGGQKPGITGNFPISPSDPAYRYDTNPNQITAQSLSWTVPADPSPAATPGCLPLGPIGVFVNGVVMFNALDDAGRDAGAHEVQDSCDGHPQQRGMYHYHDFSACLATAADTAPGSSTLVGYALDGYGVFVERDAHGNLPTDADLDSCHGRTSTVVWDGKATRMYHYDVTLEYPYFVGCFHGTSVAGPGGRGGGSGP